MQRVASELPRNIVLASLYGHSGISLIWFPYINEHFWVVNLIRTFKKQYIIQFSLVNPRNCFKFDFGYAILASGNDGRNYKYNTKTEQGYEK